MSDDEFVQLQDNAAAFLQADAAFTPPAPKKAVTVLTERIGNIESKIETALAQLGISAVIVTPVGKLPDPVTPVLDLVLPIVVQISENVTLNQGATGSKISALQLVKATMRILHLRPHAVGNGKGSIARFQLTETPFTLVSTDPQLVYHVNLEARLAFNIQA